ncbi:hypothetical protein [Streptomyces sp. NPDC051572]|uniref:hypothetical protein n=1 Tax=unclassified Streptomyces TaxID=2593676 RepID=UPI003450AA24|nr:hypothetical protein OG496_34420 [Streptomyces sp. NBC_00988]
MSTNIDTTPAELRRRLVDSHVSVPRESRVRAAAAIQGAQAARDVRTRITAPGPAAQPRRARHWE